LIRHKLLANLQEVFYLGAAVFEIYLLSRWAFLPKAKQLGILHMELNVEFKIWFVFKTVTRMSR